MFWSRLARWSLLGVAGIGMSAACGGRNSLPTGEAIAGAEIGGASTLGGNTSAGGSVGVAGAFVMGGNTSTGGSLPVAGTVSMGGAVIVGGSGPITGGAAPIGGMGVCVPGLGFCKGNTIALCDATGSGYVTMACAKGQTCEQMGDITRCVKQICTPGAVQCDAAGGLLQVCSADGASFITKQDCGGQGQRCRDGACRSLACQPNERFCDDSGVRLCNADGSASSAWQNCGANQYCDPKSLSCQNGICPPNQPSCNGSVATTCNANGSGYLMGGTDCAKLLDRQCVQGSCLCGPNEADCDGLAQNGCESNVSTDPDNCGGCDVVCSSTHIAKRTCDDTCNGICQAGFDDCNGDKQADGCETDLSSDAKSCGACGVVCSNNHVQPSCVQSSCAGKCAANFNDCNNDKQTDGCESNSRTDAQNCGACGVVCSTNHVKPVCSGGACGGTCLAGFDDCNGNKQTDGCETNLNSDANNCGACGKVCANGESCAQGKCGALYSFSGIAKDLPISQLSGWKQCFSEPYGNDGASLSSLQQQCSGSLLMMACRVKGSDTLRLAAYAPRADVMFDTGSQQMGTHTPPHSANGVGWYFNASESWGFAPDGDVIERNTCDTQDSTIGNGGVDGDKRLCWHTGNSALAGGWRCGTADRLNASFDFERLLFTAQ